MSERRTIEDAEADLKQYCEWWYNLQQLNQEYGEEIHRLRARIAELVRAAREAGRSGE